MTKLERYGAVFDESTDWFEFLRRAARGQPSAYGLARDLDTRAALGDLYEALQGTPMQSAMASTALTLFETGIREERDLMRAIPMEEAPGAKARLLRLLEQDHDRLTTRDVTSVLHDLLEKNLGDPEVAAALQRELERPDSKVDDLGLAARHLPDWFIKNLPLLRPPPPIEGGEFVCWLIRVPEDKRVAFLDSLAALGKPYVDALIADHLGSRDVEFFRQRDRPFLEAHPVFRQALAEALKEPPTPPDPRRSIP